MTPLPASLVFLKARHMLGVNVALDSILYIGTHKSSFSREQRATSSSRPKFTPFHKSQTKQLKKNVGAEQMYCGYDPLGVCDCVSALNGLSTNTIPCCQQSLPFTLSKSASLLCPHLHPTVLKNSSIFNRNSIEI